MTIQRKIIHIDMDCFYAAIEMRDFPELAHQPVAVGGDSERRGVIATCNYEARRYGVHSAMATAQAYKLCPKLILQPVRMSVYRQESQKIRDIFADYTPLIEPLSLDEAYLDVSEATKCHGSATWIAEEIRQRIWDSLQLTASAGIAPNKSLAKIASDWHKPNGQKVIQPEDVAEFMLNLPVRKLFGVGPKMEQRLLLIGVKVCADLQKLTEAELCQYFGLMGSRLFQLARGIDDRPVNPDRIRKSISVEETYPKDLPDISACLEALPHLIQRLEQRINQAGEVSGFQSLFIKLKFQDFQQTTVEHACNTLNYRLLEQLLKEGYARQGRPVRLLGVGVRLKTKEYATAQQLTLDHLF